MPLKSFFSLVVMITVIVLTAFESNSFSQQNSNRTGSGNTGNTGGSSSATSGNFGQQSSLGGSSATNLGTGSDNFIGSGSSSNFIGGSASGTTSTRNTASRTSFTSTANRNTGNRAVQGGGNNSFNQNTQVKPVYTLGFTAPKQDVAAISSTLRTRVNRAMQSEQLNTMQLTTMQLEFNEGVATVRGTVATENDRKVAENMIRLQPGVTEIKNEIQVESATPSSSLSPSARQNPQLTEVTITTTPQGRPLVHVF